ncbi:single-stranded DNA-binding protein [Rhodoflexus sp.]
MKGFNKVTLIGHASDIPDVKTLSNQLKVAKLILATNDSYKDEQGQLHTQTDWHTVIFGEIWQILLKNISKKAVFCM